MTPEECVAAVKDTVVGVGGRFMLDKATADIGKGFGYRTWQFYFGGRGGVLGDVDADVVRAAFVFFPGDRVRSNWEAARAVAPPAETAARYAAAGHDWARGHLAGWDGAAEFCALAARVVDAADPAGRPVFAGWRALPLPDDAPARALHLLHLLREHRGGGHAMAVLAAGLQPAEAIVASQYGAQTAGFFGWPEPYPDPAPLAGRLAAAEETTTRLAAEPFAVLTGDERARFAALADGLAAAAG